MTGRHGRDLPPRRASGAARPEPGAPETGGLDAPTDRLHVTAPDTAPARRRVGQWAVLAAGAAVLLVVAIAVGATDDSDGPGVNVGAASTETPLGCPPPVPAEPLLSSSHDLECTERALIGLVCDLEPAALLRAEPGSLEGNWTQQYYGRPPFRAQFIFQPRAGISFRVSFSCTIPAGGGPHRLGHAELTQPDWNAITTPGAALPAKLQPRVPVTTTTTYRVVTPSPADPAADARAANCSQQAFDIFTRLARDQLPLPQARAALPPQVPPSALTNVLEGVRRYESDGLTTDEAISRRRGRRTAGSRAPTSGAVPTTAT